MLNSPPLPFDAARARPWDARLARLLVAPLKDSWVSPNMLTTVRLAVGLAAAAAFTPGSYGWSNLAALLLVISNFLDHTDGELARLSGKSSRFGHIYDLASDAAVTILLFVAIGAGLAMPWPLEAGPMLMGGLAGAAVSITFYLRMRIEDTLGKQATKQASFAGFETEDVLYLFPLATLFGVLGPLLATAAIVAPLFAAWVALDYWRLLRRDRPSSPGVAG